MSEYKIAAVLNDRKVAVTGESPLEFEAGMSFECLRTLLRVVTRTLMKF